MGTINRGVARGLSTVYIDAFETELDRIGEPTLLAQGLFDTVSGSASQLNMTWMRNYSMMREWVGERDMLSNRQMFESIMFKRKFEDSIRIEIEDIEDGRLAERSPENETAALVQAYNDRLEFEMHDYFTNAFNTNYVGGEITGPHGQTIYVGSLDGEPVLSDAHPYYKQIEFDPDAPRGKRVKLIDGGTYSNLVNDALDSAALWNARRDFMTMKNYRGQPANMGMPDTLVVGPELEKEAREILDQAFIEQDSVAVDNIQQGQFNVVVDPWLYGDKEGVDLTFGGVTYTDQTIDLDKVWYLVNTTSNRKPFVFWNRTPLQLQQPVGTDLGANPAEGDVSYSMFKEDAIILGARARFGISFGTPQTIYASLGGNTLS